MASPSRRLPSSSRSPPSLPDAPTAGAVEDFKLLLEAVFDEELAELAECSLRARGKVLEASGAKVRELLAAVRAAEVARAEAQAQLRAEEEKLRAAAAAADHAAATSAARIRGLRDTVNLQAAKIAELGNRLGVQTARSDRLGAKAARVPKLEARIAEDLASLAQSLDAARREALLSFTHNELPARLAQAAQAGFTRGRDEGFQLGFYRALRKICGGHPELRGEAARLSVREAMAEAEADIAAELQAQLNAPPTKKVKTLPEAGPSGQL